LNFTRMQKKHKSGQQCSTHTSANDAHIIPGGRHLQTTRHPIAPPPLWLTNSSGEHNLKCSAFDLWPFNFKNLRTKKDGWPSAALTSSSSAEKEKSQNVFIPSFFLPYWCPNKVFRRVHLNWRRG
jgi:hypothetical protein